MCYLKSNMNHRSVVPHRKTAKNPADSVCVARDNLIFLLSPHRVQACSSDQLAHTETLKPGKKRKKKKNLEITDNLKLLDPAEPRADKASCGVQGLCEK